MSRHDEVETMACYHDTKALAEGCKRCFGSERRPVRAEGHFWADGVWHKDKPPSQDTMTIKLIAHPDGSMTSVPKPKPPQRKPVSKAFKTNDRTRLREAAIALAISSASVIYRGGTTADQVLLDAEYIARWIADTPLEEQ